MNVEIKLIISAALFLCAAIVCSAGQTPFWLERSSYVEGDYFYAVGKATNVMSEETGRREAFVGAMTEVYNYIRLTDLGSLPVETQMTYALYHDDRSIDVYRLIKVDHMKLLALKEKQLAMAEAGRAAVIAQANNEIASKKRFINDQTAKAKEIKELNARLAVIAKSISALTQDANRLFVKGMTVSELEQILGKPRGMAPAANNCVAFNYGRAWVHVCGGVAECISPNYTKCEMKQ